MKTPLLLAFLAAASLHAVVFAPGKTIYVQPSPMGGVNMFSTGLVQP